MIGPVPREIRGGSDQGRRLSRRRQVAPLGRHSLTRPGRLNRRESDGALPARPVGVRPSVPTAMVGKPTAGGPVITSDPGRRGPGRAAGDGAARHVDFRQHRRSPARGGPVRGPTGALYSPGWITC